MESFDSVNVGDEVTVIARKSPAVVARKNVISTYVPDYEADHDEYPDRWTSVVWAKRDGAILILSPSEENEASFSDYEKYYTAKMNAVIHPLLDRAKGVNYYEIYSPANIVSYQGKVAAKVATSLTGMTCCECKNGYPYAEANFAEQLVCWSCRDSLRWKYKMIDGKVQLL